MANKICVMGDQRAVNYNKLIKVVLPYGANGEVLKFTQGDQIVAEELADGMRDVLQGALVTDADNEKPAIIINQKTYEDEFGNRHGLVANVGLITYKSGEIVTAYRPEEDAKVVVSLDAINGTPVKGEYLVPAVGADGENRLVPSATVTGKVAYKVMADNDTTTIFVGGRSVVSAILRTIC